MTHPLMLSVLEAGCAADAVLRRASVSSGERQRLREALSDLRVHACEVVVRDVANGHGDLTVDVFAEVVKRAHEAGIPYPDLVSAFNKAQGTE